VCIPTPWSSSSSPSRRLDWETERIVGNTLERFFEIKTGADVEGTMAFFSPDLVSYIDATLGWDFDSYDALRGVFEQ
jgi:hypothetical protein